MIREYTFRQQHQNRGMYASISFEIHTDTENESQLTFNYEADLRWKVACEAGVLIFYDYFRRSGGWALSIRVTDIKWYPVDTNHLIIIFSTVKGLCEALNLQFETLIFDGTTETFNFPENRAIPN